jgi:hypothetical protein
MAYFWIAFQGATGGSGHEGAGSTKRTVPLNEPFRGEGHFLRPYPR